MEEYKKAPFTYEQHLGLLETRGLKIDNPELALAFLKQVNYYRFTAYCIPFQKPHDVFIPGTTFTTITTLYRHDEHLRNAVFAMLSPVEIFLRTQTAYELSYTWGTFAHYNLSIFQNETDGKAWLDDLEKTTLESKEPFLNHYQTKYDGFPRLPVWMACEIISLGSLSKLFSLLKPDVQRKICTVIEVDHRVFQSWLHAMTFLRNICAHHGRLWSRNFSISPRIPDKNPNWLAVKFNNKKLYTTVALIEWICNKTEIPMCNVEAVYQIMQNISNMDTRFSAMMGVPVSKTIGLCWK
jgi:abortive infection bacteriophage resistance protein